MSQYLIQNFLFRLKVIYNVLTNICGFILNIILIKIIITIFMNNKINYNECEIYNNNAYFYMNNIKDQIIYKLIIIFIIFFKYILQMIY